jgi:group I intron endonuclease
MLIYKAEFPNKKCYVGLTTLNLEKRKCSHKNTSKKSNLLLYKAIRKYGWDNVVWTIIEDNITDITILNEREAYWIKELNALKPNGYNLRQEGKNRPIPKETAIKIGIANKGKIPWNKGLTGIYTNETLKKMSDSAIERLKDPRNNSFYGHTHTEQYKKERSEYMKELCKIPENNPFYGHTHTEQYKKQSSERLKGKTYEDRFGEERAKKIKDGLSNDRQGKDNSNWKYYYKFVSPKGIEYKNITSLYKFCKKYNLNYNMFRVCFYNKKNTYKNWKLYRKETKWN